MLRLNLLFRKTVLNLPKTYSLLNVSFSRFNSNNVYKIKKWGSRISFLTASVDQSDEIIGLTPYEISALKETSQYGVTPRDLRYTNTLSNERSKDLFVGLVANKTTAEEALSEISKLQPYANKNYMFLADIPFKRKDLTATEIIAIINSKSPKEEHIIQSKLHFFVLNSYLIKTPEEKKQVLNFILKADNFNAEYMETFRNLINIHKKTFLEAIDILKAADTWDSLRKQKTKQKNSLSFLSRFKYYYEPPSSDEKALESNHPKRSP